MATNGTSTRNGNGTTRNGSGNGRNGNGLAATIAAGPRANVPAAAQEHSRLAAAHAGEAAKRAKAEARKR